MSILLKMTSELQYTCCYMHAECIYYDVIPTSAVGYAEGAILGFYPLCVQAVSACVCRWVCVCGCVCGCVCVGVSTWARTCMRACTCTCVCVCTCKFFLNRQLIEIAEGNPAKFRLNYGELETRKQFIRDTRSVVKVCPLLFVCTCHTVRLYTQ